MAKPIKMTDDIKKQCLEAFIKQLNDERMAKGTFEFKKTVTYDGKKECEVVYSEQAWYKTLMLIEENPKEVGWHGICRRDEEDPAIFYIDDIVVYPQEVTGSTITPDTIEYTEWMNGLDDNTFNNMRAHVHSHVNMGVTPSGTDNTFRKDRLSQLGDEDYYIFQIMNKKGEINSEVYDFKNNIMYESKDVKTLVTCACEMDEWDAYKTIGSLLMACKSIGELQPILELFENAGIREFLTGAKDLVKEVKPTYGGRYNGYYGSTYKRSGGSSVVTTNLNGTKVTSKKDDSDDDIDVVDDKLSDPFGDPFGYMDERGRFHGSGSYSDPCNGDCDCCDNVHCAYNDAYYDNLSYYGGWYNR